MVNKCRIPRASINSSPTPEELIQFTYDVIVPYLTNIYDSDDIYDHDTISFTRARLATIAFIKSLGEGYESSEYKYIE
jgi:hypothetical protein